MEENKPFKHDIKPSKKPPIRKGKSLSGRKPGYRMKGWQKEVQLTSLRNRDLENFNLFLSEFVVLFRSRIGETFYILPDRMEGKLFFQEDHIYRLKRIFKRKALSETEALFFYENINLHNRKMCLKTYEQYSLLRDRRFFPADVSVRESLFESIRRAVFMEGLRFPEQELIVRSLSSIEKADLTQSLTAGRNEIEY